MEHCLDEKSIHGLERLTRLDELESLRPEWEELWGRCPSATPFQSPEWLIAWWRHLGRGELWVLALREEMRLRAVAPFFIPEAPVSSTRQLQLLGTGISDYLDLLIEPDFESAAIDAIRSCLDAYRDSWDLVDFQQLPGTSALLALETLPGWTSQLTVQEVCPVLRLPSDGQELPACIPAHMLAKLRYYRRRAETAAPTRVEAVDSENFHDLFERFLQLHQARWGARGQNGVLADEHLREFHREVAARLLARGALRLYGLRVGAETVASLYGFSHRRRSVY
jgi:CelD/BcsL family acetyltransferase involved in cellulose biosynthesis